MKAYLDVTRSPWCSYVFVLPLLVLYQGLALVSNFGVRRQVINGADALLQSFLSVIGLHGWVASWIVIAAIVGVILYRSDQPGRKAGPPRDYFPLVLLESTVYALLFGTAVAAITSVILPFAPILRLGGSITWMQALTGSLGAGLYEELVFRLMLVGGGTALLRWAGMKDGAAGLIAVVGSSVLFSLIHYVGPLGDQFSAASFVFRMVAGILLAGLYLTRGFAVAAWTHALYDVFLLLIGRG